MKDLYSINPDYLKHLLIRTPLEKPLKNIKTVLSRRKRSKHPELHEIHIESQRVEKFMERILNKSSNCIDIGCHLGSMLSEIMRLSPQGKHMAFEPVPYKARWLKQKFPEIEIKEIGLSDTPGEATFYINTSRSGFSGLRQHNSKKDENIEKITIRCETLDKVLSPEHRVDFLKIDVEGGELAVLRGAVNTLVRHRPILLFECTRSGLSSFGFTADQIFDFLTGENSYSIFLIKDFLADNKPLNFEQFNRALQYPFQAFNFIAQAS
ncbi:FkbM family methyltransferase [Lyngbya sp. PCC 8106]|uniref:FkbM family methyltransferase n=1 Tax=Lyngbya sp. (strain PCC 8106) TaxID=313612 RepID=UPI0003165D0C|nr:FkbM family methyltransferase [Lyngbya sp. PCC 8106]